MLRLQSFNSKRWKNKKYKDIFQSPNYSRHDDIGLNYRMSEFQGAIGVAQTRKLKKFVSLEEK